MDRSIATLSGVVDRDLTISHEHGIAWQTDMQVTVKYDAAYMARCASHPPQMVAKINEGRCKFVAKHVPRKAEVIDVGVGDGSFIRSRPNTKGMDVNPVAVAWLRLAGLNASSVRCHHLTMWDTLEHMPAPSLYLDQISVGYCLFVSLPIFSDLGKIRESRHYRPGEHLLYFTAVGFVMWALKQGFYLLEESDFESVCGRADIRSFALKKTRSTV